jgi:hypothetical protein
VRDTYGLAFGRSARFARGIASGRLGLVPVLLGGALALAACASSNSGTACDPATEVCECGDGLPQCPDGYVCGAGGVCEADGGAVDAGGPDSMPLKGFGEPCTDRAECESNICILVGTGGICTDLCSGDDCPENFGCLGVLDSVEPGSVDYVCVPTSNQLCTPCTAHSECTLIGQDLCVQNALGDSFCARDCSTITCPAGYSCDTVDVDGDDYEQCIPNSGFCDCVAENQGLEEGCDIQTPAPFNTTCAGTRTCLGDGGWGGCEPPSATDDPDDGFADSNCDGIDGDVTRGIFVASAGSNNGSCGVSALAPCQTIAYGVVRAAQTSRVHVYVQTGTYNEVVAMVNGISVYGGYDVSWQRGPYSMAAHRVAITGGLDSGTGGDSEYLVIRAHDLIVPVVIDNVVIDAPDASGSGKSSYGVHVDSAIITLTNVQVLGGNGGYGDSGSGGLDAVSVSAAPTGGTGGNGVEDEYLCNTTSHGAGGGGASNSCSSSPSSRVMTGGTGGNGGEMDTSCTLGFCDNCNATSGDNGAHAAFTSGTAGTRGGGSSPCANAGNGNPGYVENGSPGSGGSNGTIGNGYWYGNDGSAGGTGQNGGGGGGGGGAGGCDDGTDAWGGGGGGGGAGGCAARGGGGAGLGAGGSFGVFAVNNSAVTMASCTITRGNGGTGGTGGNGGRGQPGGGQGQRGSNPGAGTPGYGGAGGHGGHGGGGGGGAGGRSVGVVSTPGSTVDQNCTITGGAAGGGGPGGISALAVQGTAEDDGFDGGSGSGGTLQTVRTCASATSC